MSVAAQTQHAGDYKPANKVVLDHCTPNHLQLAISIYFERSMFSLCTIQRSIVLCLSFILIQTAGKSVVSSLRMSFPEMVCGRKISTPWAYTYVWSQMAPEIFAESRAVYQSTYLRDGWTKLLGIYINMLKKEPTNSWKSQLCLFWNMQCVN